MKPTLKSPATVQSKNFENNFKKEVGTNTNLNEVDGLLTEKEQSLKKKIFSLSKMESLVFSDPKLLKVYDDMAENGEEKYGYHYNETIMNIIFNDYVLNSPIYLQKYKQAIPKKKKRRDKSGINQLKAAGVEKMAKTSVDENQNDITNVIFLVNEKDPESTDVFAYFPDENYDNDGIYKTAYSHIGQHSACHPEYANESRPATPEEYYDLKNELEKIGYSLNIVDKNNERPNKNEIEETSTTGSVGGAGMGSGGYATPNAWGGGDLMGGKKGKVMRKPIWQGGTIIQESNYLIESDGFEKYYKLLSENYDLNNEIQDDLIDFDVPEWSLSSLVNGDDSGLSDEDQQKLSVFINKITQEYGNANFILGNIEDEDDLGFRYKNDVDNLGSNVYRLYIKPTKKINEHHLNTRDEKISFIMSNSEYDENQLNDFDDIKIDKIYQIIEKKMGLSEEAKSKAQQRLFGMARAAQKGDIPMSKLGDSAKKIAKTVKPNDVEDFASTKHDDLPEKVNENLDAKYAPDNTYQHAVKSKYIIGFQAREDILYFKTKDDALNFVNQEPNKREYLGIEKINESNSDKYIVNKFYNDKGIYKGVVMGHYIFQRHDADKSFPEYGEKYYKEKINDMNEHHLNDRESKIKFIISADAKLNQQDPSTGMEEINWRKIFNKVNDATIDMMYQNIEKILQNMGIDPLTINETDQSMIDTNAQTMANKPQPVGDLGTNVDMGAQSSGGISENIIKEKNTLNMDDKIFEELDNELEAFSIHHNKLQKIAEDRKPSTLIMKDRLGDENKKNFKKDLQSSGTKEIINVEKELQWKDQQTDVGENPQKMGEDIEKEVLKKTGGNALKNVGDSTNKNGDEIPKRNMTDDEMDEVEKYRLGMHSLDYDSTNDEFEKRAKEGMGEKLYNVGREQVNNKKKIPMYNKDVAPATTKDTSKDQWYKDTNLKESVINGKYVDALNKKRLIGFTPENVKLIENVDDLFHIDFTGMGNAITSKGHVNENMNILLNENSFYTDGKNVFVTKKVKTVVNESVVNKKTDNQEFNKMKYLSGYKPNNYVNTTNTKKNRGF